jgi:hypothetical protein
MLELMSYGLSGLVAILFVAFRFACKDGSASFSDKHSSCSMDRAEFRRPKNVERCPCAADTNACPRVRNTRARNG